MPDHAECHLRAWPVRQAGTQNAHRVGISQVGVWSDCRGARIG